MADAIIQKIRGSLEVILVNQANASSISQNDLEILSRLVSDYWGEISNATQDNVRARINSGNSFFVQYIEIRDGYELREIQQFSAYRGINLKVGDKIPVGFLETIAIRTNGDCEDTRLENYEILSNDGLWAPPDHGFDTLILVDIQSVIGLGQGYKMVEAALNYVLPIVSIRHVLTYTPDESAAQQFHIRNGAEFAAASPKEGRAWFVHPIVRMLSYSKLIEMHRASGEPIVL